MVDYYNLLKNMVEPYTYKPDSYFLVEEADDGYDILVCTYVLDATDIKYKSRRKRLGRKHRSIVKSTLRVISGIINENPLTDKDIENTFQYDLDAFHEMMLEGIVRYEEHEVGEFLRWNGDLIFDPHKDDPRYNKGAI